MNSIAFNSHIVELFTQKILKRYGEHTFIALVSSPLFRPGTQLCANVRFKRSISAIVNTVKSQSYYGKLLYLNAIFLTILCANKCVIVCLFTLEILK